jgi:phytoene dehydrogenase-like protein
VSDYDAVVVGAGPNGLAAAVRLAQAGRRVLVIEGAQTAGGGTRTSEVTLPGFRHDICSAIHPFGVASPFFRSLPLGDHGLRWVEPAVAVAHPLDGGRAVIGQRSLEATGAEFGVDAEAFRRLLNPIIERADDVFGDVMRPLLRLPRRPLATAAFGLRALRSAKGLTSRFRDEEAKAYLGGHCAHNTTPLDAAASAAAGLALAASVHAYGWPMAAGGSHAITDALASLLTDLGGKIEVGRWVATLAELPQAGIVMLDVVPRNFLRLAGDRLDGRYAARLRSWRYGPGAFKMDWALDGPIPWTDPRVRAAGTVHVGGTFAEMAESEDAAWNGRHVERPFMIVAQQTVADPSRAPEGKHTAWAYCHVPNGSTVDMQDRMEAQLERFAPGFRDLVLGRAIMTPAQLETHNPNNVGGEVIGGATTLRQLLARPRLRPSPYRTPLPGVYLCSASTPPGPGVHGMCGYWAAETALGDA